MVNFIAAFASASLERGGPFQAAINRGLRVRAGSKVLSRGHGAVLYICLTRLYQLGGKGKGGNARALGTGAVWVSSSPRGIIKVAPAMEKFGKSQPYHPPVEGSAVPDRAGALCR